MCVWKRVENLIGFREWNRETWSSVSGLRYADTECNHRESERERLSFDKLEREKGWDTQVIERSEREGFWERERKSF